jgi:hypothetical protein
MEESKYYTLGGALTASPSQLMVIDQATGVYG